MKTNFFYSVIVAVVIMMTGAIGSANAQNTEAPSTKYVNIIKKDGKPAEKTLFRAIGNKLFNVKQFLYSYDNENRISQIDVNMWNEDTESWELRYSATYDYANGGFQQQLKEFKVGTLQYEIIADQTRIKNIMAL